MTQQSILQLLVNWAVFTINICCFIAKILLWISIFTCLDYLARSAKLLTGLYILLALISFFFFSFFLLLFFNDFLENNYLRIPCTDFRNLYTKWKRFECRWSIWTSFRYLKGRCHGNQFCEKMANSQLSSLWHSETEWDIATSMYALTAQMMPVYRVKIREIWSSNSRVDRAHLWTSGTTRPKKWRIFLWNISGSTGPIFTIFTLYDSALGADDKPGAKFTDIILRFILRHVLILC